MPPLTCLKTWSRMMLNRGTPSTSIHGNPSTGEGLSRNVCADRERAIREDIAASHEILEDQRVVVESSVGSDGAKG